MARPARHCPSLVMIFGLALGAMAQEAPLDAAAGESQRDRAISPRAARLITASLPKYAMTEEGDASAKPSVAAPRVLDRPANGIVRLPDYIVREPRLPTAEQVMSRRGLEEYAMKKYLGPSDGFDRGFLNAITIPEIARKIPLVGFLLGLIPSMTNEERALMFYYQDRRLQQMNDFGEMASFPSHLGDASNEKMKREVQKVFMHPSQLGR